MEFSPALQQTVAPEDCRQSLFVQDAGIDELDQPRVILGPSRFQGNGRQVLRAQNADRHTLEIRFQSLDQGFLRW